MGWLSPEAERVVGPGFLASLADSDLVPESRAALSRGWVSQDDAVLLKAWADSYVGDRSRFEDVMDYEAAVNGRAIPDLDLQEEGEARVARLLRRGLAFAWAALHEQGLALPGVSVAGYVSAAPTLLDEDFFTGNVTFCTVRPGQAAYVDPSRVGDDIVAVLLTQDCRRGLPTS